MSPWRRWLVVLAVVGLVAGGTVAALTGGSDAVVSAVPEGGSGFRPMPRQLGEAPEPDTAQERAQQRRADAGLPVPLARAAARLFLVGFSGTEPTAPFFQRLRGREWGAVVIDRSNVVDAAQLATLTKQVNAVARKAEHRPPLLAAAQLGGDEVVVQGIGPSSGPGTGSAAEATSDARRAGRGLRRRGFDMVLAPSADLAIAGGPWERRSFSDDVMTAGRLVDAAVRGWREARIAPVVGHFPGEGGASQDPELGVATVGQSREELRARDQRPFEAIFAEAPAIQLSGALFADYDAVTPGSLDPGVLATLRNAGYRGAIVSSNLTAATLATGEGVGAGAVTALKNGVDLLYVPGDQRDQEEAYRAVVRAVRVGTIPVSRVRSALIHLDRLRRAAG